MTAELIQGSVEWFQARCGKVTASRMADLMAKTKSGWSASRTNYMAELLAERLTGEPAERFTNAAMQWGTDKEPDARAAYCFMRDVDVLEVGFIPHPKIAMTGCSPDGLIGGAGLVEIKCPNTATHLDTLLGSGIPSKYLDQMQWQMACTQRGWCDFVSFDPRLPSDMRLYVARVERDDSRIAEMEGHVGEFLAELEDKLSRLRELNAKRVAA